LESSSARLAFVRFGTAAALIERRAQPFLSFLPLPMPLPLEVAGAGAGAAASVPAAPAVLGLAPAAGVSARAALHLACSSADRVLHSTGL